MWTHFEEGDIEVGWNTRSSRNLVRPCAVCEQPACLGVDDHLLCGHHAQAKDKGTLHLYQCMPSGMSLGVRMLCRMANDCCFAEFQRAAPNIVVMVHSTFMHCNTARCLLAVCCTWH